MRVLAERTAVRYLGAMTDATKGVAPATRGVANRGRSAPKLRPRETPIVRAVLAALQLRGAWCWRANSGALILPETAGAARRVIRGAPAGTPDILGALPGGILFGIEVKAPGGKVRPAQAAWIERARASGARAAVVFSAAEALRVYDGWVRHEIG